MANDDLRPAFVPNLGNYIAYGTDGAGSAPYFDEVGHLVIQPATTLNRNLILPVRRNDAELSMGVVVISKEDDEPDIILGHADPNPAGDSGFAYLPATSGPPSGAPTDYGHGIATIVDKASGTLYFHTGASWEPVSGSAGAHQNLGAGVGLFKDNTGGTTGLRSLVGTGAVTISIAGDTVEIDVPSGGGSGFDADTVDGVHASELQLRSEKGQPSGYAGLDSGGKVPTAQLPQVALSEVFVVADIAARNALSAQEGDLAKVLDDGSGFPNTYIYDGSGWIELTTNDAVDSVNGKIGTVLLTTTDIGEGSNLYFTNERVDDRVAGLLTAGSNIGLNYNDPANTLTVSVLQGAASGLDADLLDGLQSTAYVQLAGAQTITGVKTFSDRAIIGNGFFPAVGSIFTSAAQAELILGGAHNTGHNVGTDIAKLLITGYDNDNNTPIYPIYVEDENGLVDFWLKNRQGAGVLPEAFFAGSVSANSFSGSGAGLTNVDAALLGGQNSAYHRARANHTGTQLASTISDFSETTDDRVAALLQNGTGISWTYNDGANTLTPAVSLSPFSTTNLSEGTNLYFTDERVDDRVAALVVGGTNIQVVYDDGLGTLTLNVQSGGLDADTLDGQHGAYYQARANHTGTQLASTISDLSEAVDDRVAALLVAGANIEHIYNDSLGTLTVNVTQGAGSTLDADLLDGEHGSFYRNAGNLNAGTLPAARFNDTAHGNRGGAALHALASGSAHGFMSSTHWTKLEGIEAGATADQTASEILALLLTVDGAESGLDADLLDGIQGSGFVQTSTVTQTIGGSKTFDILGAGRLFIDGKLVLDLPSNSDERGPWNPIVTAIRGAGRRIYADEEFASGVNSVAVYNNAGNGAVVHERDAGSAFGVQPPNSSGQVIKISYLNPPGSASPGFGGFVQNISSAPNKTFIQVFQALLPSGRSLNINENAQGTDKTSYWLTNTGGTGKWEWYVRVSHCGSTGSFSSGGHVSVSGGANESFDWYLASCTVFDVTNAAAIPWTNLNHGAGSGLHADLLDGQHGAFYQNADNLNAGTLPAARFNDTAHGSRGGAALHALATTGAHGFMSSTDKTKLDGIEEGATADQTAADIRALGFFDITNDGSGSGLDADLLDGLQGSAYVQLAGAQTLTGVKTFTSTAIPLYNANPSFTPGSNQLASIKYVDDNISAASDPLTVKEADGTPSVGNVSTLEALQSSGLVVTNPSANTARLSIVSPKPAANNTESVGSASFKYADVYATNVHTGDLWMNDPVCPICEERFEVADSIVLCVMEVKRHPSDPSKDELRTVPRHVDCPL